jgi:nitrous oxide reductase accessory protein NosL
MMRYIAGLILLILWVTAWTDLAVGQAAVFPLSVAKPGPRDLCPVCGMLVSKYPNWTATVVAKDGHTCHFDGAKDMFRFLQAIPKYASGLKRADIKFIVVTEFYNLEKIEAVKAFFVVGSDVMGPMGHELVPFLTRADAEEFLKEHKGKRVLGYEQVTPEIVMKVDAGKF